MSGSRPAQMSAMATESAVGEHIGEVIEQRGGPVVRERLVDGPHGPAGLALADGPQRLADGRGVVRVVVVDDDPCGLALALEAAPDALERREAAQDGVRSGSRPLGPHRPRRGRWRRCGGPRWRSWTVTSAPGPSSPSISRVVPSGSSAVIRPIRSAAGARSAAGVVDQRRSARSGPGASPGDPARRSRPCRRHWRR